MNSEQYNALPETDKKHLQELMGEAKETTVDELKRQGVDKITYFERRKENLKAQLRK